MHPMAIEFASSITGYVISIQDIILIALIGYFARNFSSRMTRVEQGLTEAIRNLAVQTSKLEDSQPLIQRIPDLGTDVAVIRAKLEK